MIINCCGVLLYMHPAFEALGLNPLRWLSYHNIYWVSFSLNFVCLIFHEEGIMAKQFLMCTD